MPSPERKPELTAPAGGLESLFAAVNAGADAAYLGLERFNARGLARNFDPQRMNKALISLRILGVKSLLTLNTLVHDSEFPELMEMLDALTAPPHAFIIQDPGLIAPLRDKFPAVRLHASTQMAALSLDDVRALAGLGFDRAILARELGLDETLEIIAGAGIEIEVFVHGALCYGVSGRCLFSSMAGRRSGNRGNCAQPCRMLFRLHGAEPGDWGHVTATRDLCRINELEPLLRAGVAALKIEGRSRSPRYAAVVTRVYRKALDRYLDQGRVGIDPEDMELLEAAFERELTTGFDDPAGALQSRRRKPPGPLLGRIEQVRDNAFWLKPKAAAPGVGDLIEVWTAGGGNVRARVAHVASGGRSGALLRIEADLRAGVGDRVFLAPSDDEAPDGFRQRADLDLKLWVRAGKPLELEAVSGDNRVRVRSEFEAEPARGRGTAPELVKRKLAALDFLPLAPGRVEVEMGPGLYVPFGAVSVLRDRALIELWAPRPRPAVRQAPEFTPGPRPETPEGPLLVVEVPAPDFRGLEAADEIVVPMGFDVFQLGEAGGFEAWLPGLEAARDAGIGLRIKLPPVVFQARVAEVRSLADRLLDRGFRSFALTGLGQLAWFPDNCDLTAESGLNLFNAGAAGVFSSLGFRRAVLSPELNAAQIAALLREADIELEVMVYGRLPALFSRWGLGGRVSAQGLLEDRKGFGFPVRVRGGVVTIFNSRALDIRDRTPELIGIGVKRFRAVAADREEAVRALAGLRAALEGAAPDRPGDEYTTGHYFRGV